MERYLIDSNPNEPDVIHKKEQKNILFGLVMMDLYACGENQNDPKACEACSTIYYTIINSKDQPVDPETLKGELFEVVNEGRKASQTDRRAEYKRVYHKNRPAIEVGNPLEEPPVFGLMREKNPSLLASYLALYDG